MKAKARTVQLGAALVEQGYLSAERLNQALAEQKRTGRMLGRVLIENNFVSEEQVAQVIASQLGLPYIDLRRYELSADTAAALNELQARRFRAIVLQQRDDACLVGMTDPANLRAQDELAAVLGQPIDIAVITNTQFNETVDRLYRRTEQIGEFAKAVERDLDLEREGDVVDLNQSTLGITDVEAPVVKLLNTIFEEAAKMRASDIHIEPQENKLQVRFRIDGVLHPELDADIRISAALIVRLKLMAGLDISEKRMPQDGRIALRTGSSRIDVRVSTMPVQFGESVVMRLLVQGGELRSLAGSGMPPVVLARFMKAIKAAHGIVLVTGPTGSGKSTTLYGALQTLNQPGVKILTCEDPVEYRIPGINQVQVNEKIDLSFARVLRSFLRQDPDILLVGEIRDQETAQIAMRAAMTGHLVLSTLHTNDAVSTPGRLLDMGVPGFQIASTLLGVVSQRLLRLVCNYCAEPSEPTVGELAWLRHQLGGELPPANFRAGKGCPRCNGLGFSGRQGIFEMLEMNRELADIIHGGNSRLFEQRGRELMGQATLVRNAIDLALAGRTTVAEAMSIASSVEP